MAKRQIRLLDAAITNINTTPKDDAILTDFHFISKFDQVAAEAMGIKYTLYDGKGALREGVRQWELETLMFGAKLSMHPTQPDLFKGDQAMELDSIKLAGGKVRKLRADGALRLSFTVTVADIPFKALKQVEVIKRSTLKIVITPAVKGEEDTAKQSAIDYGLFKEPKGEDDNEDGTTPEAGELDEDKPGPDEPQELTGAALASWRALNAKGKKPAEKEK